VTVLRRLPAKECKAFAAHLSLLACACCSAKALAYSPNDDLYL
jgi:hypothetical protein